ncbi:Hypothetical protein LUCI_4532 [Lucifera butyrica]|uniref:Uncharacterized protein n=1 Tax=Lucifera butyrica TaxID=1351585 RepID=A0A498RGP2_9FIRM|nr:hypothetical protein [Lucifera butyrica]VBB09242.1 Hypothetical protein LUCI_4532 [Lucifera butyrica]
MAYLRFVVKPIFQWLSLGMAVICSGAYLTGYGTIITGLVLGFIAGLFYFLLLYYQIEKYTGAVNPAAAGYLRWGWWIRMGILLVLWGALGESRVDRLAAIVGFFSLPVSWSIYAVLICIDQIKASHKLKG